MGLWYVSHTTNPQKTSVYFEKAKIPKYNTPVFYQNQDKHMLLLCYMKTSLSLCLLLSLSLPLGDSDSGLLLQTIVYICFSFMWRILIPYSSFTDLSLHRYAGMGKTARVKGGRNKEECRAGLKLTAETSLAFSQHLLILLTTHTCNGSGHTSGQTV